MKGIETSFSEIIHDLDEFQALLKVATSEKYDTLTEVDTGGFRNFDNNTSIVERLAK